MKCSTTCLNWQYKMTKYPHSVSDMPTNQAYFVIKNTIKYDVYNTTAKSVEILIFEDLDELTEYCGKCQSKGEEFAIFQADRLFLNTKIEYELVKAKP